MLFPTTPEKLKILISASLGEIPADVFIIKGKLANVYTLEIEENKSIAIKGDTIVYVGNFDKKFIGKETLVIDASNEYIIPGFVETHTHIAQIFKLSDFVNYSIKSGTTTVVTETGEFGNVLGKEGIEVFLNDAKKQPIKIFLTLPPLTPPFEKFETSKGLCFDDYRELLDNPEVLGLGESYWPEVVNKNQKVLKLFAYTLNMGKMLQAHSAGARGKKLNAYITSGVTLCHEPISKEELIERLNLGLDITIREGSVRKDFSYILEQGFDFNDFIKISVSTDGILPSQLIEEGLLDNIARKGIRAGIPPLKMIQMLTLNAATFLNLQNKIGSIGPGKIADIIFVKDLYEFQIMRTISNGKMVYENEKLLEKGVISKYPEKFFKNIKIPFQKEKDFSFNIKNRKYIKARCVDIFNDLITKEKILEFPIVNNGIDLTGTDALKYFIFNRYGEFRKVAGFLTGSGIYKGAFASTMNWENYQLMVIGKNNTDMAIAVNRIIELNGGMVVVENKEIIAELPLEMSGFMSSLTIEEISRKEKEIVNALNSIGCKIKNPFLILQTLSFTGLPFIRLTDKGLVDVRKGRFVEVLVDF